MRLDLSLASLRQRYLGASLTPAVMVDELHAQMLAEDALVDRHIWIHRLSLEAMQAYASALEGREKQPRTGEVPTADASRAPAGAPRKRTVGMRYEPVVSPPANISRPSRTPCCGALG
jgi:hypothetical protein